MPQDHQSYISISSPCPPAFQSLPHSPFNLNSSADSLNVGLEQPIANWAKLGGTARRPSEEGLPGRSGVIAHCTDPRATSTYRTIESQESRASVLVSKLATARVFCYPPTTLTLTAPSLSPNLGIYRCQRSHSTRAAASPPMPPTVETWKMVH